MAKVLTDESNLEAIGDAIRDRLQVGTTYLPSEMASAIESIRVIDVDPTLTLSGYAADAKVVGDKFDGLLDRSLSLRDCAAEAKATGEAIADLQKNVDDVADAVGVTMIEGFVGGQYIQTNGNTGTTVAISSPQTSSNFAYKVVSVSVGDKITLNATGGNAGRLWAFVDSSNALISKADANAVASNLVLTAPANAAKLVINVNLNATIGANYIGTSVDSRIAGNVDATLSEIGMAAEARATGDAIADTQAMIPALDSTLSISGAAANAEAVGNIVRSNNSKEDLFEKAIAVKDFEFIQLKDSSTIHGLDEGAINPCSKGDIISFGTQSNIRHFYVIVTNGEIYKVKIRKLAYTGNYYCIVFTDEAGVVILPQEMVDGNLSVIENVYTVPDGATRMYVMSQDVGGANTDYTSVYKAQSKNLTERNNLITQIIDGYWTNSSLNATSGTQQNFKSVKVWLTPGEYTVSFGTPASIIRIIINGQYCQKTVKIPENGCYSFRVLTSGYAGLSFYSKDSEGTRIAWNTWALLESGDTIGYHNDTCIDVLARKKYLDTFIGLQTRVVKTKDLLNGYYSGGTYTQSDNRLTTFNWIKIKKGDIVLWLNQNIVAAFIIFDESGNYVKATQYVCPSYITGSYIEADSFIVQNDGYMSMNLWDNSKGSNVDLDPLDYDNIFKIISIQDESVWKYVYTKQSMFCNMKAKKVNVSINGQDGCIVGNKLYSFADGVSAPGAINAINLDTMENGAVGYHQLGHANAVDYDERTNTLITYGTNGTNRPTIVLYKNPDFSGDMRLTDSDCVIIPLYNDSEFMNTSASVCFGESSEFVYFMEGVYVNAAQDINPTKKIYKILLGMGDNDLSSEGYGSFISGKEENEYNGTCKIIKIFTGEIIPGIHCFANANSLWTVQGMKFDGFLFVAYGTAGNNNLKIALNEQSNSYAVVNNYHFEITDYKGNIIPCEPELLAIRGNKMYCGINDRSSHDNYLYEIQI